MDAIEQEEPQSGPCRYLRSHEMYFQGLAAMVEENASGTYWCQRTQENFGPDGEGVKPSECCGKRSCCLT